MLISGLVVTLEADTDARERALAALACDCRISLGHMVDDRLPIVTETEDAQAGYALAEALFALPGVRFVDVVYVDSSLARTAAE